MKLILATALAGAMTIGATVAYSLPAFSHTQAVAVTWTGDEYIVGEGDTCADAMQGAVIPDDWQSIDCRRAWGL